MVTIPPPMDVEIIIPTTVFIPEITKEEARSAFELLFNPHKPMSECQARIDAYLTLKLYLS